MNIQEDFTYLEELLRLAYNLISPSTYKDDLNWMKDRSVTEKMYNKCPSCFLTIMRKDKGIIYFPICNRARIEDPRVIKFSIIFAGKLSGNEHIDEEELKAIMKRLERLNSTFSKPIPRSTRMAILKGRTTKQFKGMRKYLDEK